MPPADIASYPFTIEDAEIDALQHLLLERGQPLSTVELALALIENRYQHEEERARAIYQDCTTYDPAGSYEIGERLLFSAEDNAIGEIIGERAGQNEELGDFRVLQLQFEDGKQREYAASLTTAHTLNRAGNQPLFVDSDADRAANLLAARSETILPALAQRLRENGQLAQGGDAWFPHDLLLEINAGQLQLLEAVLQLDGGGPLRSEDLLVRSGEAKGDFNPLLIFSLNVALREDERFTEVGPAGYVLWHLTRMLPAESRALNQLLRYTPAASANLPDLNGDMRECIRELDDEWSATEPAATADSATLTLTYPHRRAGTLPLNSSLRGLFPQSRNNHCIWMSFVDGKDGENYPGWIWQESRYVLGLAPFFRKHLVPIGAYILLHQTEEPTHLKVDYIAYNERSENVRLAEPRDDHLIFSEQRRPIGVAYDDLMIFGIDDLAGLDRVAAATNKQPLAQLLRDLAGALSVLTPQGAIHFKTLYSAANLLRRVPPAPLCAALLTSEDFRSVGGNYWTLTR